MTKRQLLKQFYLEAAKLRKTLKIQGMPEQNLFENGLGWDGDLDHELLVIVDGLGAATLQLLDQGCETHRKHFTREADALRAATYLFDTAQGYAKAGTAVTIDDVQWDTT
jgi:hypothetical protein